MTLSPGTQLGPYEIVSQLGSGGMGVVYEARDPRLKRTVAIKLLPPDLTKDDTAKQRFLQEAQAASALDHPNICTIYEINETDDGQLYLVMAHYEGETLKERIERGPLELDDAIDIATQVGQGLAEAHGAGIVHRDIKPANLFVTKSGVVKILDFGLAKLAGAEGVTQTGTTVGTVAYMSPEQARGQEVDHRTDIWSLGVVLYEMLAGHPPFTGDNLLSISHAIVDGDPPSLTGSSSSVQPVVGKALSKDKAERYKAVADLLGELGKLQRGTEAPTVVSPTQPDIPSIAVLPFVNMSPDPENAYFSDGLSEEIINALTKLPRLRVIARTSAFRFRGEQNLRQVGEALGVNTVLEGSVRKAGNRLRITAQLINITDDSHLWSERFDRELTDIFAIQDEIAATVAAQLQARLGGTPSPPRPTTQRTTNVEAYEALAEGRHYWSLFTPSAAQKALDCFERALSIDPEYADAVVSIALHHGVAAWMFAEPRDALNTIARLAARALELDPDHGEAHGVLAFNALWNEWDWDAADRLFRRGITLAPSSENTVALYGALYYLGQGKFEEATAQVDRSLELDPLGGRIRAIQARVLTCEGRFEEAEVSSRRALELDPGHPLTLVELGYALAFQHKFDEALVIVQEAIDTFGALFMTVWRLSTRSAENSYGIRQS